MALSKQEMWNAATDRYIHIHKLYNNPDVSAESMFEELCCSIYGGDEWNETEPEQPVKISVNEFKYRGVIFRVTKDETDDKSYIWCDACEEFDTLVHWVWGSVFAGDTWLIGTEMLDKFIESHKKEEEK